MRACEATSSRKYRLKSRGVRISTRASPEEGRQLALHRGESKQPRGASRFELDKDVDVAPGSEVVPQHGAEQAEPSDMIVQAERAYRRLRHGESRGGHDSSIIDIPWRYQKPGAWRSRAMPGAHRPRAAVAHAAAPVPEEEEGGVDYPAFTGTAAGTNPAACSGTSSTIFHASRSSRTRFAKAVCSAWPARWATRCPMIG